MLGIVIMLSDNSLLDNPYIRKSIQEAHGCDETERRLTIIITNACQFKCEYCIRNINKITKNNIRFIDPKYIEVFFNICKKNSLYKSNSLYVYISGGEATLSPYFLDIVRLCASCEFVKSILLLTNGYSESDVYVNAKDICSQYGKNFNNIISFHYNELTNLNDYIEKVKFLNKYMNTWFTIIADPDKITNEDESTINNNLEYIQRIQIIYSKRNSNKLFNLEALNNMHNDLSVSDRNKIYLKLNSNKEFIINTDYIMSIDNPFRGMYCTSFNTHFDIDEYYNIYPSCSNSSYKYKCYIETHVKKLLSNYDKHICYKDICCYASPIRYKINK